jgi:Predicted P-loop-containing kinase
VLAEAGHRPRVVYVHARDEVLVRRYESNRREHPLQGTGTLIDGITEERALLTGIAGEADLWVDTSDLNIHQLRATLENAFAREGKTPPLTATVLSFGFKYGLPLDADLVVDARFLPNPHWLPDLRPHTGQDPDVRDYVLGQDAARPFLDRYTDVLRLLIPGYRREGKRYLTLAVGCTGGKHRSVAIAEEFARRLRADGVDAPSSTATWAASSGGPGTRPVHRTGRRRGPAAARGRLRRRSRAGGGARRLAPDHAGPDRGRHRRGRRRLLRADPAGDAGPAAG